MKAEQIIKLREKLGLTQAEFAERIGVSRKAVNAWENEQAEPRGLSLKVLKELAEKAKKRR